MAKSEDMKGLLEYLRSAPGIRNVQYFSAEETRRLFRDENINKQTPAVRRLLIRSENISE